MLVRESLMPDELLKDRKTPTRHVLSLKVTNDVVQVVVEVELVLLAPGDVTAHGGALPKPEGVWELPFLVVIDVDRRQQ